MYIQIDQRHVFEITLVTTWSFPKSKRKHANFKVNNERTAFRSKFSKETLFDEVVGKVVYATNALYVNIRYTR